MKIKRLVTNINASFEGLVSKLENNKALADSKIQAVKKSAVKVSTHLGVVRYRLNKLLRRESELESSIERWRMRALEQNRMDQRKALQCVQALNKSQELLDQIRTQLSLERRLEQDLQVYLTEIEASLSQLQVHRDNLSARERVGETSKATLPMFADTDVECIFSRSEETLDADEFLDISANTANQLLEQESNQKEGGSLSQQLESICEGADVEQKFVKDLGANKAKE